jgi:hypothetical protein
MTGKPPLPDMILGRRPGLYSTPFRLRSAGSGEASRTLPGRARMPWAMALCLRRQVSAALPTIGAASAWQQRSRLRSGHGSSASAGASRRGGELADRPTCRPGKRFRRHASNMWAGPPATPPRSSTPVPAFHRALRDHVGVLVQPERERGVRLVRPPEVLHRAQTPAPRTPLASPSPRGAWKEAWLPLMSKLTGWNVSAKTH